MTHATDRPYLGILLMLGFCLLAPVADALAKVLGATVPLAFLVLLRFSLQSLLLAPVALLAGGRFRLPTGLLPLVLLRAALHVAGVWAMFLSLRFLPLAEAIAIAFVMPFLLLLLGRFVLNEEVGPRRLLACIVGFAGTLMVIQPTFAETGPAALLPLLVALFFALFMLVTRRIAPLTDPLGLQAITGVMGVGLLLPVVLFGAAAGIADLAPVMPTGREAGLILVLGAVSTVAHLLMTWSLRFAPSATLAPMQYLEIPVATLIGWLVFRQLPDGLAAAGIAVTMAAGLYIILRERALSRR